MQPIYTQTASGSSNAINFNNIPQTFTDLKLVISARINTASVSAAFGFTFNNVFSGSLYSNTQAYGTGSAAFSNRLSSQNFLATDVSGTNATASTFSSNEFYLPNYTSSNFKSFIIDAVSENNATSGLQAIFAGLFQSTSPITSIQLGGGNTILQNSTFTLYGITKG